jgi:hypothetical protein
MRLTEEEWRNTPYPAELLRHVEERATPRQLRLFACHCCKRLLPLLTRATVRHALETADRFADGRASAEELTAAHAAVRKALAQAPLRTKWEQALMAVLHAASPKLGLYNVMTVGRHSAYALDADWSDPLMAAHEPVHQRPPRLEESRFQCQVLRDVFPFRSESIDRSWLTWEGGEVVRLARGIYDEERFHELYVLGDALEEAGCGSEALLMHARQGGPHFRGCWLVDAVLQAAGLLPA